MIALLVALVALAVSVTVACLVGSCRHIVAGDPELDVLPPLRVVAEDDRPLHELIGEANAAHLARWYEGDLDIGDGAA